MFSPCSPLTLQLHLNPHATLESSTKTRLLSKQLEQCCQKRLARVVLPNHHQEGVSTGTRKLRQCMKQKEAKPSQCFLSCLILKLQLVETALSTKTGYSFHDLRRAISPPGVLQQNIELLHCTSSKFFLWCPETDAVLLQ